MLFDQLRPASSLPVTTSEGGKFRPERAAALRWRSVSGGESKYVRLRKCSLAGAVRLSVVLVGLTGLSLAKATAMSDFPFVSTIAGTGASGLRDGPARSAQFMGPTGLAFDRHGNLYIVDRPAQRIRELSNRGLVSTIAGSGSVAAFGLAVPGGYQDGAAHDARFNYPNAVAVGSDGAIYVADTLNRVIRRIQNGYVTTFAGTALTSGSRDGARDHMLFSYPRSIAFDRPGNLYVADFPNGVRRIDRAGTGTTILSEGRLKDTSSVTVVQDSTGSSYLIAASDYQIVLYNLTANKIVRTALISRDLSVAPANEGVEFAGPPAAIAAFNPDEWAVADALDSTIELHQGLTDYVRVLGAVPPRNASNIGGDFKDGPGLLARFNEPLGIAITPNKSAIVVADSGNRRIRFLSAFDRRSGALACCSPESLSSSLPPRPNKRKFRIALVGPSYVWYDVPWSESIAGFMEASLNKDSDLRARHLTARVFPIRINSVGAYNILDYVDKVLTTGAADQVIAAFSLFAGKVGPSGTYDARAPDLHYGADFSKKLSDLARKLASNGTSFLAVPYLDSQAFPLERSYMRTPQNAQTPDLSDFLMPYVPAIEIDTISMLSAVKASRAPYLDMANVFVREELSATHRPLFQSWDPHFTPYGNTVFAAALVRAIEKARPWRRAEGP